MLMQAKVAAGRRAGYEAEATALFARMSVQPTTTRKSQMNDLIKALKSAGLWAKMTALYVFANATQADCLLNWISTSHTLSYVNTPTWSADHGFTGSPGGASTKPALATDLHGSDLGQNSVSLSIWYNNLGAVAGNDDYADGGGNTTSILLIPKASDNTTGGAYLQSSSFMGVTGPFTANHLVTASRTASNVTTLYVDGVSKLVSSTASATPDTSSPLYFLGYKDPNNSNIHGHPWQEAFACLGAGLTSTEAAALDTAVAAYMTAIGNA